MKNNPFTRFLSVALTAAMLVGVMPGAVLADAGEAIVGASSAIVESIPESTTPEDAAPVATEVPPVTEPEATPETVVEPEASPEAEATPEATEEPEATPEATEQPEATPEATQEPEATPEATEQPEATPEATQEPEATPEATEEPETVEGVYNGMAADELFNAFLACQSVADVDALLADLTDEDLNAFAAEIGEDSMNALQAHFQALLDAEELPEEPAEEEELPEDDYVEHVPEIVEAPQPVVPFTDAVPMFTTVSPVASTLRKNTSMQRAALMMAAPAANNAQTTDVIPDNGLQLRKWVDTNEDGTYTVNLEVWTEGTVTSSETTKPLDIVLVLDQSGSMADGFTSVEYKEYTDQTVQSAYNSYRNNTYVQLGDDSYSKVTINYTPVAGETSYDPVGNATNSELNQQQERLYYYENGQYYPVSVDWSFGWFTIDYTYSANGKTWTASGRDERPNFEAAQNFFYASTEYIDQYTFTYTDKSGQNQTVYMDPYDNAQQSFGQQANGQKLYYTQNGGSEPRLDALVTAVNGFIDSVAEKAKGADGIAGTDDDVSHRIAIVGFSSAGYKNTELLTGVTVKEQSPVNYAQTRYYPDGKGHNGPQYYSEDTSNNYYNGLSRIAISDYQKALQDVSTDNGRDNVKKAVTYLTAEGGTQTDAGMDMANEIFARNPINEEERDRVVIVFTDGIPTGESSSYNSTVANLAIEYANTAKTTYGADVYAIGIFNGADATDAGSTGRGSSDADKGNYFMQNLSSNNGIPQSPSYYLSASNSSELNAVFEAISETTGSSQLDLDANTVVKDVLTQYFTVPNGAETQVTISTKEYDGENFVDNAEPADTGVTATINPETGEISVKGFDFSTHFISANGRDENNPNAAGNYHGEKLIISFPIVPKEEFWGGNKVPTNDTDASGVFDGESNLVENFPTPDPVDVPLKDLTLTSKDVNIYYGNTAPTAEQLVNTIYQPDDWRTDYVDQIVYQVQEDTISNTEDGVYTITAVLSSKEEGKYGPDMAEPVTANVYVYAPIITWKDTTQQAGTDVDLQFDANKAGDVIWKHGETLSTAVPMQGTEPTLTYTFATAEGEVTPETFTEELHIEVTAVRNEEVEIPLTKVQFDWAENEDSVGCLTSCEDPNSDFQFRIHIPTTTLTLTKEFVGLNDAEVYYILFGQAPGYTSENFAFDINYCNTDGILNGNAAEGQAELARLAELGITKPGTDEPIENGGDFRVVSSAMLTNPGSADNMLEETKNEKGASLYKNTAGNWVYQQEIVVPVCPEGYYFTVFEMHAEVPGYAKLDTGSVKYSVTSGGVELRQGYGKFVCAQGKDFDNMESGTDEEDYLNDTFYHIEIEKDTQISFENNYTDDLTIKKTVEGVADEDLGQLANRKFTIVIEAAVPNGLVSGLAGKQFKIGETVYTFDAEGKAEVQIANGEEVTLKGLPAIQYKITEKTENLDLETYRFVEYEAVNTSPATYPENDTNWNDHRVGEQLAKVPVDSDATVALDVDLYKNPNLTAQVTVTNTYEVADGVLIINKIVSQFANNGKPVFDFKVTSQEEDGTVYYFHIDMTGKNEDTRVEVARVTLPAGTYKVEELSNQNYTQTAVAGLDNQGQVEIGGEEDKEVTFTNAGKNTNIPTDGSAAENTLKKDSATGEYILSFEKKELGADGTTPTEGE